MNLQNELDGFREAAKQKAPPHVVPTIEATIQRLRDSHFADGALRPRQTITDFELPDATGKLVSSADLRRSGPLLILFYRGTWCPFCNLTVRAYQERLQAFQDRRVTLVAISPQTPDNSLTLQQKHSLKFPLLSDRGNTVARQFGIVFQMDPALKQVQKQFGVDIASYNGDDSFELPLPGTFLVSRGGMVLRSFVEVDYMRRLEPETAINWIDEIATE
ncbi:MAG TPA: peroxiredoxin-like family protein [Acidobacteriaceae bacterium]|nr:peroxiredoxin-like family protein [Acidobacteriaceae bacterium]